MAILKNANALNEISQPASRGAAVMKITDSGNDFMQAGFRSYPGRSTGVSIGRTISNHQETDG
ncbi:MAG TPA: hypothetical protein VGF27_18630 [Pseudoduganella sp.]